MSYNSIDLVISYYESPNMLKKQLGYWKNWTDDTKNRFNILIGDDGSQEKPAENVLRNNIYDLSISLYRIKQDIPWNIGGVRNLLFSVCNDGWILMTDIDHVIIGLDNYMVDEFDPQCYYQFKRFRVDTNKWDKPHRDTILVTKDMYWKTGGFDEDFSGYYGGKFIFFHELNKHAEHLVFNYAYTLCFENVINDATVKKWGRKNTEYDVNNNSYLKRKMKSRYNPVDHLRFDWERIL